MLTKSQAKIAEMYKVKDENCVAVFGFKNAFGGGRITGFGLIYDSVTQAKRFEPKHRLLRLGLISKKGTWAGGVSFSIVC